MKPGESSPEPSEPGDVPVNNAFTEDLKEIQKKLSEYNKGSDNKEDDSSDDTFKCLDCLSGVAPPCFICRGREDERVNCSVQMCGKYYHVSCLKKNPQTQWQGNRFSCPYHGCHTCTSDDPQSLVALRPNEKLVRCVRCPSSYHPAVSCLPAGSQILTGSQIVCPRHQEYVPLNANWCFLCTKGGTVICCDTCPSSFHLECIGLNDTPEDHYICEDCESGRFPLYREIVWVKLGHYRWWPALIPYPQDIPANVMSAPHKQGEFCVMFLGSRDYYWVNR